LTEHLYGEGLYKRIQMYHPNVRFGKVDNIVVAIDYSHCNTKKHRIPYELLRLCKELKYLWLQNLKLTDEQLSYFMLDNKTLEIIHLEQNGLTKVPEWMNNVTGLTELYLDNNKITSIGNVSDLKKLKVLHLGYNQFKAFPVNINGRFHDNAKIKQLVMSGNEFKSVPDSIQNLKHLVVLDLKENKLKKLPNLDIMVDLTVLDLSKNLFEIFPRHLLPRLSILDVNFDNNKIEKPSKNKINKMIANNIATQAKPKGTFMSRLGFRV